MVFVHLGDRFWFPDCSAPLVSCEAQVILVVFWSQVASLVPALSISVGFIVLFVSWRIPLASFPWARVVPHLLPLRTVFGVEPPIFFRDSQAVSVDSVACAWSCSMIMVSVSIKVRVSKWWGLFSVPRLVVGVRVSESEVLLVCAEFDVSIIS